MLAEECPHASQRERLLSFDIRNLRWLRSIEGGKPLPVGFGARLFETFSDHIQATRAIESQTNANGGGNPLPPPAPDGLSVAAQNGVFHVSVQHNAAALYRGVNYHLEYSEDPGFSIAFPVDLGSAREHRGYYGNMALHWRAAASYGISPPSNWVYFGGAIPQAVQGGGVSGPALPATSQGSGTGARAQGLQGPGQAAFRGSAPPVRGGL